MLTNEKFIRRVNEPVPVINSITKIEEDNYISIEGAVKCKRNDGNLFDAQSFTVIVSG